MGAPLDLRYLLSATDVDGLPPTTAEVALVGRSNVGKSSLLNALARRSALAHTSKSPGRTRALHCYAALVPGVRPADGGGADGGGAGPGHVPGGGPGPTVVDCPGYGYAAVSRATRASWQAMIARYLLERDGLAMVMALVDGEVGPTDLDLGTLRWLRHHGVPHTVVATKHDKVRASRREARKRDLAAMCQLDRSDVVWTSAATGVGIDRLRDLTRVWLAS